MIISGVGRLGKDAELRTIPSGTSVANLALAFNFGQKQADGNRQSQWIDCSLWGKQAEVLTQYLKKGNQVSVTASDPHVEEFTRGDGTQGSKMVAMIVNIELISNGQQQGGQAQQNNQQQPQQNNQQPAQQNNQQYQQTQNNQQQPQNNGADQYDDVPF